MTATLTTGSGYEPRHPAGDFAADVFNGAAFGPDVTGQGEREVAIRPDHGLLLQVLFLPDGDFEDVAGVHACTRQLSAAEAADRSVAGAGSRQPASTSCLPAPKPAAARNPLRISSLLTRAPAGRSLGLAIESIRTSANGAPRRSTLPNGQLDNRCHCQPVYTQPSLYWPFCPAAMIGRRSLLVVRANLVAVPVRRVADSP